MPRVPVRSFSSVVRVKGKEWDPQAAGRELKVDVANDRQLWGYQYDRAVSDVLAVQEQISREISDKLRLRLSGDERRRMGRHPPGTARRTSSIWKGGPNETSARSPPCSRAATFSSRRSQKDPRYALAYAGLKDAYALLADYNVLPAREVMPRVKSAAARALALDGSPSEAHASLGWVKFVHDWDWPGAAAEFKRAIDLNPG